MANGSFVTFGSPYSQDHAARTRQEREREEATQERAEKWITRRLAGRSFGSLEELADAACGEMVEHYQRALTEQEHTIAIRACNALFGGWVDPRYFIGKIKIVRGESITFLAAA